MTLTSFPDKIDSMKAKATHSGTCQVCGRLQKLPGNHLSLHGYTKQWGFFSGTCPGAHYKPFEQAYDRIEHAITRTKIQIENLQAEVTRLQGPIESNEAPYRRYDAYLGGYSESTVIVSLVNGMIKLTEKSASTDKPGKTHWGNQYGLFSTVEHAIRKLRDGRITRIARDIQQREEYVQWQEKRVREWKPGVLVPVKEAA